MDKIIINKEGNYKNETISSIPIGLNNIMIDNNNFDLKKDQINNIKPMLSNNSSTIFIPDGKKVKIKPFNKKVPLNTLSMMANPKKNLGVISSEENSIASSNSSETDDILKSNSNISLSKPASSTEEEDEDYSDDDYSSIASNRKGNKIPVLNTEDNEESEGESEYESDEESEPKKQKTYEEIQQEKQKLLFNLERLQKQGYPPSKRYSMASSYEDMLFEHDRLKKQRDVEKSIKFSRKILMAFVSGIEFLNGKFDYFDIKLE